MWKPFTCDNKLFLSRVVSSEVISIYLTDLKNMWSREFSKQLMCEIFKECNADFEMKQEDVSSEVCTVLNDIDKATLKMSFNKESLDVKITNYVEFDSSKFKVKYNFTLYLSDQNKFLEMVTIPMIQTINHLEKQQKTLSNLLEKKDRELAEYKLEKDVISRIDLITEKFDTNTLHVPNDKLFLNTFQRSKSFSDYITQEYGQAEEQIPQVEVEPWNNQKRKRRIYNAKTARKRTEIVFKNK